jgi:hypothetical protein
VRKSPTQDHVHRERLPDGTRQPLRSARAGYDADSCLRLAEFRALRRNDQVTGQRQLAAAAEAVPGDRCDERRPEAPDRVPALDASLVVEVDRRGAGQLRDVRARSERLLVAAEDDAPHRVVAVELLQLRDELFHQLVGERVQRLGAVQLDDRNRSVPLDENHGHGAILGGDRRTGLPLEVG